ncbi:MAG: ATP-binding cassette domain-containing protein [Byssovorax sp.]
MVDPAGSDAAIEARGLTRRFGELTAVDHLDLRIDAGVVYGLLGSNGAGKTTTIRMLTTLTPPSEGSARVAGFDVAHAAREVRRRIGYVPQLVSSDGGLSGYENLLLSAKLHGIPRAEREARIAAALDFMDLGAAARKLVRGYSGGMIRRLEVAQAMLHEPAVLFLDEPTVGLDPVARHAVWERLRELRGRFGTTILLTTHDMEEADALCDTIGLMHKGKLATEGSPEALKQAVGPEATLDDVFVQTTGGALAEGGNYRDVAATRRTARRLS